MFHMHVTYHYYKNRETTDMFATHCRFSLITSDIHKRLKATAGKHTGSA